MAPHTAESGSAEASVAEMMASSTAEIVRELIVAHKAHKEQLISHNPFFIESRPNEIYDGSFSY